MQDDLDEARNAVRQAVDGWLHLCRVDGIGITRHRRDKPDDGLRIWRETEATGQVTITLDLWMLPPEPAPPFIDATALRPSPFPTEETQ